MPSTYEPIATTTIGTAVNSYTFSSIPGTYTDLVIICNGNASATVDTGLRFNGDTGSNYSYTRMYSNGSATASDGANNMDYAAGASWYAASTNNTSIINVMNYANTTAFKTVASRSNATSTLVGFTSNLWRSTAAITSVTITTVGASTYSVGTTFTLYGIKAA
jgi:hypothetical protein